MSGSYGTGAAPGPAGANGADSADEWRVSGYTPVRELGAGASGRVVLARHDETGTPVAIKYLSERVRGDDRFLAGFRAEARLLGALESPHVVQLYEYVETQRGAAIVMELVDGIPLRALLRQEGATGPEAALSVLKGSLLGLAAAHAAGVVHRDYKPDNVLVADDGSSKLVDFGIALPSGESGDVAGTPVYMAPEQWTGQPASPATDVYAATATFFECLTGAKPYAGTTAMELAIQHMEAPIPDDLAPETVRPLIRRGLAKNPEERPASAADFVTELEAVATAAYGEDWEERGQRGLAALAALLLLLFPSSAPITSGTTTLATTTLGEAGPKARGRRRPGRRAKALAGATAGVLLTGTVALTAAAAGDRSEARTHTPVVTALSSVDASLSGTGTTSAGPSPTATESPKPSVPTEKGSSPTADAPSSANADSGGGAGGGSGGGTASGGGTTGGGTTGGSTSSGGSTSAGSTGGGSASGGTTAPATTAAPQLDVVSVTIQASGPFGSGCAMVASITVQTDGAADGTMTLTWFDSTSSGQAGPTDATDSIPLPKGKTQISGRYTHTFGTPDPYPYVGVKVTTSPAADSGNGSIATITAPSSCNPIR